MIVKSEGFEIGDFKIPSFELKEGEMISICLFSGGHFFDLEMELVSLLTGSKINPNLKLYQTMEFVEHIKTNGLKNLMFPLTVGKYLNQNGKATIEEFKKVWRLNYISSKTKVNTLTGNPRKWLSLISTLSIKNTIVFDLVGQDPIGAEKTLEVIHDFTSKGGAAILLDNFNTKETKCVRHYKIERIPSYR